MATWSDPRSVSVAIALGANQFTFPIGLTYTTIAPGDDPDTGDDPGPVLAGLRITRGRVGDAPETAPTRIELRLRNEDGIFSPDNVAGPYYGQLRKGTPLRVYVDVGSGPQVLATAYVESWNPIRSGPNLDPMVNIVALGALERVSRDTTVESRMKLRATRLPEVAVLGYWPMEDRGTQFASGVGGEAFTVDDVAYASDSMLTGSLPLPTFGAGSSVAIPLPSMTPGTWSVGWYVRYPAAPGSLTTLATVQVSGNTVGSIVVSADATTVYLEAFDTGGSSIASASDTAPHAGLFSGEPVFFSVRLNPSTTQLSLVLLGDVFTLGSSTISITNAAFTACAPASPSLPASAVLDGASMGHVVFSSGTTPFAWQPDDITGGDGETASTRMAVLTALNKVWFDALSGDTEQLAGIGPTQAYRALRDAEAADEGNLYEARDGFIVYQPRVARYNTTPLELRFGNEDGTDADESDLVPLNDSRDAYNVITVSRSDGSFAVAEQVDGPLGSDTDTGIGPRPLSVRRELYVAGRLADHANWLRVKHTIDKARFVVAVDLYANPSMAASVIDAETGQRVQIIGAPAEDFGPDTLDGIAEGERMTLDADRWLVEWFCEPYAIYDVAEAADSGSPAATDSRADTPGCTLAEDLDTTETGVDVTNTDADFDWSATAVPYDIGVGGERMTVTAVSGSGASQTLTVTRSVNGVVKSHSTGAAVALWDTPIVAL